MKLPDLHNRRTQLALGGAGAVTAYALYRRHVANAGSSSTNAAGASVGSITDPVASDAFGASSLENSIVGDLQPQIDNLASQLSGIKTTPGPQGPTGKQGPPGKSSTPTSAPKAPGGLPKLNSSSFAVNVPLNGLPGNPLDVIGTITAPGQFTGHNVSGGAPIYAILPGFNTATQDFKWGALPVGTKIGTFSSLKKYITAPVVTFKPR